MSKTKKIKYIVHPETGCWYWMLDTNNGYGRIHIEGTRSTKKYAHRFYYEQKFGKIPYGKDLDHLCKVRRCVNPDHMEVVSRKENINRTSVTKLTKVQINEIRQRAIDVNVKFTDLAKEFNVDPSHISKVVSNQRRTI